MSPSKIAYTVTERDGTKFWTRIGTALQNADGSFTVKLEALPVSGTFELRDALPDREQQRRDFVAGWSAWVNGDHPSGVPGRWQSLPAAWREGYDRAATLHGIRPLVDGEGADCAARLYP